MYILKCSSLPFISVWVFRRPPMAVLHFYEAGGLHDSIWFLETRPWKCLIWNINHSLVLSPLFTSNCRYSWCQIWTVVSEWGIRAGSPHGPERNECCQPDLIVSSCHHHCGNAMSRNSTACVAPNLLHAGRTDGKKWCHYRQARVEVAGPNQDWKASPLQKEASCTYRLIPGTYANLSQSFPNYVQVVIDIIPTVKNLSVQQSHTFPNAKLWYVKHFSLLPYLSEPLISKCTCGSLKYIYKIQGFVSFLKL